MKYYLLLFRRWYEERLLREQLFIILLSALIIYCLFYILLFYSVDTTIKQKEEELVVLKQQAQHWRTQIDTLNQLTHSPLYKKWVEQRKTFEALQIQYKQVLKSSSIQQWQQVIEAILKSQTNVTLAQVKNFPETAYNASSMPDVATNVYRQKLIVVVYSDYFNTLNYIEQMEKRLPNLYWDNLTYEVTQYPLAKIEMEFSIFYEKS